jgi:hypothetical protein
MQDCARIILLPGNDSRAAASALRRKCEACSVRFVNRTDFDGLSESEKKHFHQCSRCREMVDMRQLDDVLFRETDHKPRPDIQYGGSERLEGSGGK